MEEHVVIIGNGIAGITAARHIRRISEKKITVISSENKYFFSRTALMYVFMGHMQWNHLEPYDNRFWDDNRIGLKKGFVNAIRPGEKKIIFSTGEEMTYDSLILATGSLPRKLGWKGEDLPGVQGLVSKQDLELLEQNVRDCSQAVIVGGGLIGVELAEMLHSRNIPVCMLIRETAFWRNVLPQHDADLISRHIERHGISLQHNTELEEVIGHERVRAIKTSCGKEVKADLVGLAVGVAPNLSLLEGSGIETETGILVDPYLRTNVDSIYAIGDCAQLRQPSRNRRPIEAVWYTARMMGETVAQTVCGNPFEYRPGNWFNSAKFFDIEYQTYGQVSPDPGKEEQHFHWEHPSGSRAITISYDRNNLRFLGINSFGIRMRHEVFDSWLNQERTIEFVLENLPRANFDPEFYDQYHDQIFQSFNHNKNLV